MQAQTIDTIVLTVSDLDRAIAFYTQALEFQLVADLTSPKSATDMRSATLKLGDEQIRLQQDLDWQGRAMPEDSRSNDCWFQHLAIVVSDMERAYQQIHRFSVTAISTAPQTIPLENEAAAGIQSFKFKDHDLHPLELICFPPAKGQPQWHRADRLFLGIDHTAIVVSDTATSLKFYCDYLGMQVEGGSFNWGETQARMDDLPNPQVRITALRPLQGGLGIELLDYLEPADGRPFPPDLVPADIAYVRVEMTIVTEDRGTIPQAPIQDPTGHFIALINQSTAE